MPSLNVITGLFVAGIFFGAGPCMASCGPLLLSYVVGTKKKVKNSLKIWLLFSSARLLAYMILGLFAGFIGQFAFSVIYKNSIAVFLVVVCALFIFTIGALMLFGERFNNRVCRILSAHLLKRHTKSVFLFGLIIGIFPCGPLTGILTYIVAVSKDSFFGLVYGASFGLGTFISPLVLLMFLASAIPRLLDKSPKIYLVLQRICGVIVCFLGLQLIFSVL